MSQSLQPEFNNFVGLCSTPPKKCHQSITVHSLLFELSG